MATATWLASGVSTFTCSSREAVEDRRLEVEHADHPVLVHERHHQLRAGLGDERQVARVAAHVADEDRLLAEGGRPA